MQLVAFACMSTMCMDVYTPLQRAISQQGDMHDVTVHEQRSADLQLLRADLQRMFAECACMRQHTK